MLSAAVAPTYRHPAAQSFDHGYDVAIGCGVGCLALAVAVATLGLRSPVGAGHAGDHCVEHAICRLGRLRRVRASAPSVN